MKLPAVLATLFLLGALPAGAQGSAATSDGSAASPGDVIRLMVWRSPEFTGDFAIAADGTILHPLLSEVHVAGASNAQLRARLAEALRRYESDPHFVFSVLYRIAVTGEVSNPGLYPLPAETTIPQAVAAAGGATALARAGRVVLWRDGQATLMDLRRPDAPGANVQIRPGDRLEVPRHSSLLREVIVPFASVVGAIGAVITVVRS